MNRVEQAQQQISNLQNKAEELRIQEKKNFQTFPLVNLISSDVEIFIKTPIEYFTNRLRYMKKLRK